MEKTSSLENLVKDNFQNQLDALLIRKQTGELSQEEYLNRSKALSEKRSKQLETVYSKSDVFIDDAKAEKISQLEDQYDSNREEIPGLDKAINVLNNTLPQYNQLISELDDKVAKSMDLSNEEAKVQLRLWEQGRGGMPVDAYNARKKALDTSMSDIQEKYPLIPQTVLDYYSKTATPLEEKNYSDLGDRENPYSFSRQELVDSVIEKEFPDLDRDTKVSMRRRLIDYTTNKATFDKASEKAKATLEKAGIKAPEEVMEIFGKEAGALSDQVGKEISTYNAKMKAIGDSMKSYYELADAQYVRDNKGRVDSLRQSLDVSVQAGTIGEEEAVEAYKRQLQAFNEGRKMIYNKHVEKLSRQQRQLIEQSDKVRDDHQRRLKELAQKNGLELDGETVKLGEEYINKYNGLVKQYAGENQEQALKAYNKDYSKLSFEEKISNAWNLGYMDMAEGFGGGMKWLGWQEAGNFLTDISENANMNIPVKDFGEFNWSQVTDPDWWISKGVRTIPVMMNLALAGGGTTSAVAGKLGATSLSPVAQAVISGSAGAVAMRPIESFMEAGGKYEEAIKSGKTDKEAGEAAAYVFRKNMNLILLDAMQLGLNFGRFPGRLVTSKTGAVSSKLHKISNSMLAKGVLNFVSEGGEEVYQEYVQRKVDNPLLTMWRFASTPEGQEAFALGGFMGVGMSMMSGSEQSKITHVNKMIKDYMNQSKGNQDGVALKRRQMQLLNTLEMLKERNVITENELDGAQNVINESFESFEKSLSGEVPIDWNSDAHTEYTILASQHRNLRSQIEQDKGNPDNDVKKAQMKAISSRMVELVQDPKASTYAIDGIPFSREDFETIVGINPINSALNPQDISVRNDHEMSTKLLAMANPAEDNSAMVEQYINDTEGVTDVTSALDAINGQLEGARKDGDTEHMADLEKVKLILEEQQKQEAGNDLMNKYRSGTLHTHLNSLPAEQAINEAGATVVAMEREGVSEQEISQFKDSMPELFAVQEENQAQDTAREEEVALPPSDLNEAKVSNKALNVEADFFNLSIDDEVMDVVEQEDPDLVSEINKYDDIDEVPIELKQQFVSKAKQMLSKSDGAETNTVETATEPVVEVEAPTPTEIPIEPIEPKNRRERRSRAARKEKLKKNLKGWLENQQKLRLTPFSEETLMEDLNAARDLAELAYLSILDGVQSATGFASELGVEVNEAIRQAWNIAIKRYRAERQRTVLLDSQLSKADATIEFFQDKDIAVKRMIERLREQGIQVGPDEEFYLKRELMTSRSEDKIRRFIEKIIGRDTAKGGSTRVNKESFFGRLEEAGIDPDDLSLYMYALHAPAFNARVKEMRQKKLDAEVNRLQAEMAQMKTQAAKQSRADRINELLLGLDPEFEVLESGSGMKDELAEEVVTHFETQPDGATLTAFAEEFRETVVRQRIDMLESAGMIDADTANHLRNGTAEDSDVAFEHYIPLKVSRAEFIQMNDPSMSAQASRPGILQRIKGTGSYNFLQRNNPLTQAMVDYVATIRHIENNETNKSLMALIENNPDNMLWDVVPSRAQVVLDEDGNVTQTTDLTSSEVKQNSITAIVDGKVKYLYMRPVYDKDGNVVPHPVMVALKRSSATQGWLVRKIIDASRFLINIKRNLVTTYNIAFGVPNAFRDVQEAMANITTDKEELGLKQIRRNILKNIIPAYRAIAMSPWKSGGNEMLDAYFEAKEHGMNMSWSRYEGSEEQIKQYEKDIEDYHKRRGSRGLPAESFAVMANVMQGINDVFEMGTRLAVYKAVRDAGVDPQKSAAIAKNISLNFEKKGTATGTINSFYLFANAGIQGVARGGKLLYSKKGRRVLGVIMMTSFLNSMLLDLTDEDDELDVYGSFDRDNNFFIYNPWEPKEPFRIPKPYSFVRFAANFGEAMYDVVAGKTTGFNAFARVLSNLQTVTDPVGGAQENVVSSYTPTMFKVFVEWQMNEKWNGTPFYFGDASGKKGSELKTAKTAQWAVDVSDTLDDISDFFGTEEGMVSISPALIEYVVKDFFGGVGKETTNIYEMIDTNEFDINKLPIARRFYTDLDAKQELYLYRLYELTKRSNKDGITKDEIKIAREAFKISKEKGLTSGRTLSKLRSEFEKKYKVDLD